MSSGMMICLPVLSGDALPPIPEGKEGYELALHMAGAEVMAFKEFGSYQGDWWARVRLGETIGWVNGKYGSCSGCDAFWGDLGDVSEDAPDYAYRLAEFGRNYLERLCSQEAAEAEAGKHRRWDLEADKMLAWIMTFREAPAIGGPKP